MSHANDGCIGFRRSGHVERIRLQVPCGDNRCPRHSRRHGRRPAFPSNGVSVVLDATPCHARGPRTVDPTIIRLWNWVSTLTPVEPILSRPSLRIQEMSAFGKLSNEPACRPRHGVAVARRGHQVAAITECVDIRSRSRSRYALHASPGIRGRLGSTGIHALTAGHGHCLVPLGPADL